ncbi:MAG: carboxypeptidase Taq [Bacteroidota bacterium]|nr:carboxypeptidase Taq [Bacteroidota bacterium]
MLIRAENRSALLESVLTAMVPVKDLKSVSALLGWDEETYMPKGAVAHRAEHISTVEKYIHQTLCSREYAEIAKKIESFSGKTNDFEERIFRLFLREQKRAVKLPVSFIEELSITSSLALNDWKNALQTSNFLKFLPSFKKLLQLKLQEAEYLGYTTNPYNTILDYYEPGLNAEDLNNLFGKLKTKIKDIISQLLSSEINDVENEFLFRTYPEDSQLKAVRRISEKMGFDYYNGRLDKSIHPFSTSISYKDIRITNRVNKNNVRFCLFGTIHETGHGLYEQGMDSSIHRTFAAEGASYAIHESQALIWENNIARSLEFAKWCLPELHRIFPQNLNNVEPEDFYRAVNKIQPSLVRTDADELTYNLHIIARFEIENGLFNKKYYPEDLPDIWDNIYESLLGIKPSNDAEGCLQDIHWASAAFGYFPNYNLGKLYAAAFYKKMSEEIEDLGHYIETGNFSIIRDWLKLNIHSRGSLDTPKEIMLRVCGEPLSEKHYIDYISKKIEDVYGISLLKQNHE